MPRKRIIAGNWKMHKTEPETIEYIQKLKNKIVDCSPSVYIAVPFTSLHVAVKEAEKTNIIIGVQNMHYEDKGAYTGEISSIMLKTAKAEFVILGHSERRHIFNETDEFINKKVLKAISSTLQPILCVGETEKQREENKTEEVLKNQLIKGLKGVPTQDAKRIIIAYEPVWAIGTGKTATPDIAQKAHHFIRKCLADIFDSAVSDKIQILYGGSVSPENIKSLIEEKDIDGALIGGAALDADKFEKIIKQC